MLSAQKVLCFLSMALVTQLASAGLVIDPFSTQLPTLGANNAPTATQNVGNADRFLTRTIGGVTTAGTSTVKFAAGQNRTANFFYDLRGPVDLTASGQNALEVDYTASNLKNTGTFDVTFSVLSAFSPTATVLSQFVFSGLGLTGTGVTLTAPSSSFTNVAAMSTARYIRVSVQRNNSAGDSTFNFTSALTASGTPEPASLVLAGLTGIGAFVAFRRRSARTAKASTAC